MSIKLSVCKRCGKKFIQNPNKKYQYCHICGKILHNEKELKHEEKIKQKLSKQRQINQRVFEQDILEYEPVSITSLKPNKNTLFIIGNGFDLMHGVDSSYYSFRDSLGKNNSLRTNLELALTPEDIWADFENSLGKINLDLMASRDIVDMWLDNFEVYSKNSGAADYYMAIEAAAGPLIGVADSLQKYFRGWVSTLNIGTEDKPLLDLICANGRVLSFNYTEFVETIYGVKDVCYIHGCRRNEQEKLILGHSPNIECYIYEKPRKFKTYHQTMVSVAQENVLDLIAECDMSLTKDSKLIIEEHRDFFDSLVDIKQIIVIGHSLSQVDWDYFYEINRILPNVQWYFGLFGLNDFNNFKKLVKDLQINNYHVFITNGICVKPLNKVEINGTTKQELKPKLFKQGETSVCIKENFDLLIDDESEVILPFSFRKAVFLDNYILIITNDIEGRIFVFKKSNDRWELISQFGEYGYDKLFNRRLNYVFYDKGCLTFVYNNRVRKIDLENGNLFYNKQIKDAKNMNYQGLDVKNEF